MLLQLQDLPRKVTKDFLLQQMSSRKIKAAPQFQFSNQVIALFNLQTPRSNLPLNSGSGLSTRINYDAAHHPLAA